MTAPALLLTRPAADSARVLAALQAAGLSQGTRVTVSPLLGIRYLSAELDISSDAQLIFTSRHGVAALTALDSGILCPCHCVGARTAEAAETAGHHVLSYHANAADLLDHLRTLDVKAPITHLHGTHTRGDIAQTLASLGFSTTEATLYDQPIRPLSNAAQILAQGEAPVVIPLFSPRSAAQFQSQWNGPAPIHVVALSPAVADGVQHMSCAGLEIAAKPDLPALVTSVIDTLKRLAG